MTQTAKKTFGPTLAAVLAHLVGMGFCLEFWFRCAGLTWQFRQTRWEAPAGMAAIMYVAERTGLALTLAGVLAVIDVAVLMLLARRGNGGLQAVWTGLVAVLVMSWAAVTVTALVAPYGTFLSARFDYKAAGKPVAERAAAQLEGTWQLVAREESGARMPADPLTPSFLSFNSADRSATWTLGKQFLGEREIVPYLWSIDVKPPRRLSFFAIQFKTPGGGYYRYFLYRCDGGELVLCVAPTETPAKDLPRTFETQGNQNVNLVYRRVEPIQTPAD